MTATTHVPIPQVKRLARNNALTLVWLNAIEVVLLLLLVLR